MNRYDQLLEWASEVGSGTWASWRAACDYLCVEPSSAARKLSALGHVEFDWIGDRFACAPPTAVLTLHSSGCLLLTGARPRGFRAELEQRCGDIELEYDVDLREPLPQQHGPETWLLEAEMDEVERFCRDSGFELQIDSGRRIAQALPRATLELVGERERPSDRFPRKWFDPRFRCFRNEGGEGLWWVEEHRRNVAYVLHETEWYRIATREYGHYIAYPEESFISYKPKLDFLTVDNRAPLPPQLARALTLQSGRLAVRDGSGHTYVNVDQGLVDLVAERLDAFVTETWR